MSERRYKDSDGNECTLQALCFRDPIWASSRIAALEAENAFIIESYKVFRSTRMCEEHEREAQKMAFPELRKHLQDHGCEFCMAKRIEELGAEVARLRENDQWLRESLQKAWNSMPMKGDEQ